MSKKVCDWILRLWKMSKRPIKNNQVWRHKHVQCTLSTPSSPPPLVFASPVPSWTVLPLSSDCVAVVHQRISQLSSSGLMNIESSHKLTRSGDTASGCIEGVNMEDYQVGVVGIRRLCTSDTTETKGKLINKSNKVQFSKYYKCLSPTTDPNVSLICSAVICITGSGIFK